jgi:hypothetical protein
MTPCAARNMIPVSAVEKMTFWPEFKSAREVAILTDAFSYARKCVSYRATSYRSLLKFYKRYSGHSNERKMARADLYGFVIQ